MERIFNKQTIFYLVLALAAGTLISLTFFALRDSKSLNQTDKQTAIPNASAPKEGESIIPHTSTPQFRPKVRRRGNQKREWKTGVGGSKGTQVDRQKRLANQARYEGLFEEATNLEVSDEDIIQTGE